MHGEWNPVELRTAIAAIEDLGLTQGEIAKAAGVNRSQVNRWARGENRPTYDKAMRLAGYLRREHPELADRFLAATDYGTGPVEPPPEPELPPSLLADINRTFPDEEDRQRAIRLFRRTLAEGVPVPPSAAGEPPGRGRRAG